MSWAKYSSERRRTWRRLRGSAPRSSRTTRFHPGRSFRREYGALGLPPIVCSEVVGGGVVAARAGTATAAAARTATAGGSLRTTANVAPGRAPLPSMAMASQPTLSIGRNTALLSGSLAMNSATLQLAAAVASLTLVRVLHVEGLLGLGPAIVLGAGALVALPAGLLMDRVGRVPVLAGRLRHRRRGLRPRRVRQRGVVGPARARGAQPRRGGERDRAARPHGGGRHVPARAPCPRHRARALRLGLRRDPRPDGLQPAARRPRARRRRAAHALARGGGVHGRGRRDRRVRAPGPGEDRRRARRTSPSSPPARAARRPPCERSWPDPVSSRRSSRRRRASPSWSPS